VLSTGQVVSSTWHIEMYKEGGCSRLRTAKSDMNMEESEDKISIQNEI